MRKSINSTLPGWLRVSLSVAFLFSVIAVVFFAFLTFQVIWSRPVNPVGAAGVEWASLEPGEQESELPPAPTIEANMATPTAVATAVPDTDENRVNILAMGIDRRPGEAFISRTDSMMIISVNLEDETISILSIPRDLYVSIPGRGQDRVNTAFVYGSNGNNPAGGAVLAMRTIEENLGVQLDHYVLVDFSAVINGVNAIGGIDVYVPYTINDPLYPDMNYGYDPLYIPAGLQHFDGELALKYARTRHADTDFHRAGRQQQVVLAVRDKVLSLGPTQMLAQAPGLYRQLEQGIRTDLSLEQIVALATAVSDISSDNIQNEVLDQGYVTSYTTPQGASVLLLREEMVRPLIGSLFLDE